MADTQINVGQTSDALLDYTVPPAVEFVLKAVSAEFTDNGAGAAWTPALIIYSDSTDVVARAVDSSVVVAAGDGAEASWFPGVKRRAAAAAAGGAPDYITLTGVAHSIPSVVGGDSGSVPWNAATYVTNNAALWTFTLDGSGNIIQVNSTAPGRYEAMAAFHFDAPAAVCGETFSAYVLGGVVTLMTTTVFNRTSAVYEGFTGVFGQRSSGTIRFQTGYTLDTATTSLIRGQWWWIKRWPL